MAALGAALAQRGVHLTVTHFRLLRPLVTAAARAAVVHLMLPPQGELLNLSQLERDVARITHDTWVDFHWSEENPQIAPENRMPHVTQPLPCCCFCPL